MRTAGGGGTLMVSDPPRLGVDGSGDVDLDVVGGPAIITNYEDDDDATNSSTGAKKSANMTERVPVPSSEHVAEIVGRQGCKIKALRNKTNTYIKTPVRGEEPVFVVTGRQQDVDAARREIVSAAEHFTQIRASRRHHNKLTSTTRRRSPSPGAARPAANQRPPTRSTTASASPTTTLGVRVPISMVGLVVGPKGATIKRIQADTGTYIVTPGRDRDPVFEVIGSPDAVEKARQHIDAYIETRLTTTSDQRDVPSLFRPVSGSTVPPGEIWPLPGDVSSTSRLVESRDAISRLLALSSDCGRPPTRAWHLPQTSLPGWSSWGNVCADSDSEFTPSNYGDGCRSTYSSDAASDIISTLYARMLLAENCGSRTAAPARRANYWQDDLCAYSAAGAMSASASEISSFFPGPVPPLGASELYADDDEINHGLVIDSNSDGYSSGWDAAAFSACFTDAAHVSSTGDSHGVLRAPGLGSRESGIPAVQWRLKPDVVGAAAAALRMNGGSDGATSPSSYSPAESSSGSASA